jgi:hypothetical protein
MGLVYLQVFFFFIGACLLITEINSDSKFSYEGTIPRINKKFVEYRSFKNFDQEFFLNDLEQKNLNSIVDKFLVEVFKAPIFYKLFIYSRNCSFDLNRYNVMNVAPVSFMNKNLKRVIYKKRMSFNKYNRCKNKQNWEIYRKQRNLIILRF